MLKKEGCQDPQIVDSQHLSLAIPTQRWPEITWAKYWIHILGCQKRARRSLWRGIGVEKKNKTTTRDTLNRDGKGHLCKKECEFEWDTIPKDRLLPEEESEIQGYREPKTNPRRCTTGCSKTRRVEYGDPMDRFGVRLKGTAQASKEENDQWIY